jgi:hypothetical protein
MQVIIEEVVSTIRAIDGDGVLGPDTLRQIVEAVCRAMRDEREHDARADDERSVERNMLTRERGT